MPPHEMPDLKRCQNRMNFRAHFFCIVSLLCAGCPGVSLPKDRLTIVSKNEPKSDQAALELARVRMEPVPEVLYRSFTAGIDDHLDIVIRIPVSRFHELLSSSPWKVSTPKAWRDPSLIHASLFDEDSPKKSLLRHPIFKRFQTVGIGMLYEETSIEGMNLKLIVIEDGPADYLCHIEWFEL